MGFELCPGIFIGDDHPCVIVAEIGQNHQGDIEIAKELIRVAKDAGASCVKLQKKNVKEGWTKAMLERPYTGANSWGPTYEAHKQHIEFDEEQFKELQYYAEKEIGIPLMATPFDEPSAEILKRLGIPFFKIGSCDADNFFLLERVASYGKPMVVSTGMCEMSTVRKICALLESKKAQYVLLQCCSAYPHTPEDTNLRVMETYRREFPGVPVGYSGHEMGSIPTLAAVAMGAKLVERHITLDHAMRGSDHKASLNPDELVDLVKNIRAIEACMGDGVKRRQPTEGPVRRKLGKSIVAKRPIKKGARLLRDDLAFKTSDPQGMEPVEWERVIGLVVKRDIEQDTPIMEGDV